MAGWDPIERLIELEKKQLVEEGIEPQAATDAAAHARRLLAASAHENEVWAVFANLPQRKDFPFVEPSDLEGIRAARADGPRRLTFDPAESELFDKMYGAWLGR